MRIWIFLSIILASMARADTQYPWSLVGYYGRMTDSAMYKVVCLDYHFAHANLFSLEVSRQFHPETPLAKFSRLFWISDVSFAMNLTGQDDPNGSMVAFNPHVLLRWRDFPWRHKLLTSLGIGEGISWASRHPRREARDPVKVKNARKLLNLLIFEMTLGLPQYPQWEIIYRLHHRSGVFGLYCPGRVGSTALGLGIRYNFA